MNKITCWYRYNKKTKEYEYNHFENGWVTADKPTPKFDSQKGWLKSEWKKEFRQLINHEVKETA